MKKLIRFLLFITVGAVLSASAVLLSNTFLKNISSVLSLLMPRFLNDEALISQLTDIFAQLKTACITYDPIVLIVLLCVFSLLARLFFAKKRLLVLKIFLFLLSYVLVFAVLLLFTRVNDILLLDMLKIFADVVPALL